MKPVFRCFCAIFCAILLSVSLLPVIASANGVVPAPWYTVELSDLPEGTAYVDLLIPLEESDPKYAPGNYSLLPDGVSTEAEILTYCEGGYRSYTFHYENAQSQIVPQAIWGNERLTVTFFETDMSVPDSYQHLEDVERRKTVRLALLDKEGGILKVSEICDLQEGLFSYSLNSLRYDGQTNVLEMKTQISPFLIIGFLLLSIAGIFVTCVVERLVAWPFGLGKAYGGTIIATNILSQIGMRLASVLLYGWLIKDYLLIVTLLEIPVYVGEFLYYGKKMQDVSRKKVFSYVLAANTASLAIGWLLNLMLMNG